MRDGTPRSRYLKDYRPPEFLIDRIDLRVSLDEAKTSVHTVLTIRRGKGSAPGVPLRLDGERQRLRQLKLDGQILRPSEYQLTPTSLSVPAVPDRFELTIDSEIEPQRNTELEGLYKSGGMFCTQCEPEGFRKISYYLDRPDVMARFRTTIEADQRRYPVLLSNGNPVGRGELPDGRHWVTWEDPFPKPSYLFALVAGDLKSLEDSFTTRGGRRIDLRIHVEPENADKCQHAMESLKRAMRWDDEVYGREYDLDIYMIVAVNDFNMGAMENKGLNIFNSRYVLADARTATDLDYQAVEAVIAHEYFHNWTGNRVTCRDWFQLSLKEGLTVFRDQEFSADLGSRGVKRIQDVRGLRTQQFAEDAGPLAHPVQPDAYIEINNFYTATVYNKGAEVIRMLHCLLGGDGFRRGMDLYFGRHDGQAVTVEDFVAALQDANAANFSQFKRWYRQAGTPELDVATEYDPAARRYTLLIHQTCPPTPGQPRKEPLHIPLAMALIGEDGALLPLRLDNEPEPGGTERVFELTEPVQKLVFTDVGSRPVPSLLRGFSAPVKLNLDLSARELAFLLAHDTDPFNRWEAGQRLMLVQLRALVSEPGRIGADMSLLVESLRALLKDETLDRALATQLFSPPSESYLADQLLVVDPDAVHAAQRRLRRTIAVGLRELWRQAYRDNSVGGHEAGPRAVAARGFKNLALGYLAEADVGEGATLAMAQFGDADNMTDELGALTVLSHLDCAERGAAIEAFHARWRDDPLVIDKWFAVQAMSRLPDTLSRVVALLDHEAFSITNPNRLRALVGSFCHGNLVRFHAADGAGYRFLTEQVLRLDKLNPQIAARLLAAFSKWRRFEPGRRQLMQAELRRVASEQPLSADVFEVVTKSLAPAA